MSIDINPTETTTPAHLAAQGAAIVLEAAAAGADHIEQAMLCLLYTSRCV